MDETTAIFSEFLRQTMMVLCGLIGLGFAIYAAWKISGDNKAEQIQYRKCKKRRGYTELQDLPWNR